MTIRIISHVQAWARGDLSAGTNVPASVPALRELQQLGLPHVTVASVLTPGDYHDVWRGSFLAVWDLIERSRLTERTDEPNLLLIHGYSLDVLFCQIQLLAIALDRMAEQQSCDRLVVEDPAAQPDDAAALYYFGLYSPYYHDVARHWAVARGITAGMTPVHADVAGAGPGPAPEAGFGFPELMRTLRRGTRMRAHRLHNDWKAKRFFRRLARHRPADRTVFFVSSEACGLGPGAPANAIDVRQTLAGLRDLTGTDVAPLTAPAIASGLPSGLTGFASLIDARWRKHIARTSGRGLAVYRAFGRSLEQLRAHGGEAALVMSAPFADVGANGYMAEAFRHARCRVAGIQHGGNARLVRRAADTLALTDLAGGRFFQWGPAATDEFATYGVELPVAATATGCVRMHEVVRSSRKRAPKGRRRLLYAPTLINVAMTTGANIPWDAYAGLVPSICQLLSGSAWECWVKILDWPEYRFLHLEQLPNLRVIRRGGSHEYMSEVDAIITDSLASSPFYEALGTGKPIVLYTPLQHQEWEPAFVAAVRRRALCFSDPGTYLEGVRRFLRDPEGTLHRSGVEVDDELMRKYYPPASPSHLWACIERGLFEPAVR